MNPLKDIYLYRNLERKKERERETETETERGREKKKKKKNKKETANIVQLSILSVPSRRHALTLAAIQVGPTMCFPAASARKNFTVRFT